MLNEYNQVLFYSKKNTEEKPGFLEAIDDEIMPDMAITNFNYFIRYDH